MTRNVKIKLCGFTELETTRLADNLGADLIGFVLEKSSPRFIAIKDADKIIETLQIKYKSVAVVTEGVVSAYSSKEEFITDVKLCFAYLQMHNFIDKELIELTHKNGLKLIQAISMDGSVGKIVTELEFYMFDSGIGGTGKTFDWDKLQDIRKLLPNKKIILSGGINENNLIDAIEKIKPDMLDISSGIEVVRGKKDPEKIKKIMELLKTIDH